jgi:hypothetical protein
MDFSGMGQANQTRRFGPKQVASTLTTSGKLAHDFWRHEDMLAVVGVRNWGPS